MPIEVSVSLTWFASIAKRSLSVLTVLLMYTEIIFFDRNLICEESFVAKGVSRLAPQFPGIGISMQSPHESVVAGQSASMKEFWRTPTGISGDSSQQSAGVSSIEMCPLEPMHNTAPCAKLPRIRRQISTMIHFLWICFIAFISIVLLYYFHVQKANVLYHKTTFSGFMGIPERKISHIPKKPAIF